VASSGKEGELLTGKTIYQMPGRVKSKGRGGCRSLTVMYGKEEIDSSMRVL
jgi:hypothetical protein